jgi:hypothetical protein
MKTAARVILTPHAATATGTSKPTVSSLKAAAMVGPSSPIPARQRRYG